MRSKRVRLVAVVGLVAVVAADRLGSDNDAAPRDLHCALEQTWYQGDLHFSQELQLRADGWGTWISGGMDSDAAHIRVDFTWTRDDSILTAKTGIHTASARFTLESYRGACYLMFDGQLLPVEHGQHYANAP